MDVSRARAAAAGAYQMRRGANDTNTAPTEIDALQQHGDKKCHTCVEDLVISRRTAGKIRARARERIPKEKVARWVRAKARGKPTRMSA